MIRQGCILYQETHQKRREWNKTTVKIGKLTNELNGMKDDDKGRNELTQRIAELQKTLDDIQNMFDDSESENKYSMIKEGGAPVANLQVEMKKRV